MKTSTEKSRCPWPGTDPVYIKYHDKEWGVPLHNDKKLFEFLLLEGFQAGLSWRTILMKRQNFRTAFDNFDYRKIAGYNKRKISSLMNDPGIIRNRLKIESAVKNAAAFIELKKEFGTFDKYIWGFVNYKPVINKFSALSELPARTELSDQISKDLKKRGFNFVGSTIIYAHLQATGVVNDHLTSCFRYKEIKDNYYKVNKLEME
jgi:DNA-3-methyladenine glycosylase I